MVRAYLHPARHRILQFLGPEPLTASQVAERLGVHPTNLIHHLLRADLGAAIDSLANEEWPLVVYLENARLPPEAFEQFSREFAVLVEKWRTATEPAGGTERWYSLGLALYPRSPASLPEGSPRTSRSRRRGSNRTGD